MKWLSRIGQLGWLYAIMVLSLMAAERLLVFPHPPELAKPPSPRHRAAQIPVEPGVLLDVLYCACPEDYESAFTEAGIELDRPVVLFCHGNGGTTGRMLPVAESLHRGLGADVVFFNYRGYGGSTGIPSEEGVYADAQAVYRWLTEEEGIDPRRIVLVGSSLGGAVALELATRVSPPLLVLESTFTSLPDIAARVYPWLPVRAVMRSQFPNAERIATYKSPVFISHGDQDELVPLEHGQRLFELAPGPKEFFPIPDGTHNDPRPQRYYETLRHFLQASHL